MTTLEISLKLSYLDHPHFPTLIPLERAYPVVSVKVPIMPAVWAKVRPAVPAPRTTAPFLIILPKNY